MTEDDLLAGIQKLSGFVLGYISSTDHDEAAACWHQEVRWCWQVRQLGFMKS